MKRREFIKSAILLTGSTYIGEDKSSVSAVRTAEKMADAMFPPWVYGVDIKKTSFSLRMNILLEEMPLPYRILTKVGFTLLEYSPILSFYFRKLSNLQIEERREILKGWEESSFILKKNIYYGLKALVCGVYYSLPEVKKSMGFSYPCNSSGKTLWEEV